METYLLMLRGVPKQRSYEFSPAGSCDPHLPSAEIHERRIYAENDDAGLAKARTILENYAENLRHWDWTGVSGILYKSLGEITCNPAPNGEKQVFLPL